MINLYLLEYFYEHYVKILKILNAILINQLISTGRGDVRKTTVILALTTLFSSSALKYWLLRHLLILCSV